MSDLWIGILSFPALLALIFLRIPIGLAMFGVGFIGLVAVQGDPGLALARLRSESYSTFSNYALSIIPMFLLMGHFATLGGMSRALFGCGGILSGHRRGGGDGRRWGLCGVWGDLWVPHWPRLPRWGVWPCQNCAQKAIQGASPRQLWLRGGPWAF